MEHSPRGEYCKFLFFFFIPPSFLETPVDRFTFKGDLISAFPLPLMSSVCVCVRMFSKSLFSCEDKDPTMLWLFGAGPLHVLIFKLLFFSLPQKSASDFGATLPC